MEILELLALVSHGHSIILHLLDIFLQDEMLERKYLAKNIFHRFWCSNSIKK